jgi:hypothetical protein
MTGNRYSGDFRAGGEDLEMEMYDRVERDSREHLLTPYEPHKLQRQQAALTSVLTSMHWFCFRARSSPLLEGVGI